MSWKRLITGVAVLALVALVTIGVVQLASKPDSGSQEHLVPLTEEQIHAKLVGSPPKLAALHRHAGALLEGGAAALRSELAALRGTPVVINKWASWCEPCRSEFAILQHASANMGRSVAFLGIDSGDTSRARAAAFLRTHPVSYPSFYDHSGHLGESVTDSSFLPVTVFYDRARHLYIHQGPYSTLSKFEADVRRYALHS